MRPDAEVHEVFRLRKLGHTQVEISSLAGVAQGTVSRWLGAGRDAVLNSPMRLAHRSAGPCPDLCPRRAAGQPAQYAYLLGQYLGDGTLVHTRRGVYRLFISCCARYPGIIDECRRAIAAAMPHNAIGYREKPGAVDLSCYSTHWPCLFPQHGPGRKHTRTIALQPWQSSIALERHPKQFLRGLIHSDGCRTINRVRGANGRRYAYPRYMFTNRSDDIRGLFTDACDELGIGWRQMNRYNVAVSRRASVAHLDSFIGPKR